MNLDIADFTSELKGKYVLVKFSGKKSVKQYVGLLVSNDEVKFLRKWHSKLETNEVFFVWPNVPDVSDIDKDDICRILPDPVVDRRGRISFDITIDGYDIS